ncbi:MAG TPA: hypothetical protein DDW42_03520 [Desulfobacteraceae bacterium]|nr:hypothetical protein [Desulfobacteraceae bacterium]
MEYQKRTAPWFIFILAVIMALTAVGQVTHAGVDLSIIKEINLDIQPLDIATSADGEELFVLAPRRLLVYSLNEGKITNTIVLDRDFDRLSFSAKNNIITLTSSKSKTLKIIRVEQIYPIDIYGHPFKGPANAPVTIAVFDDYQ